MKRSRLFTRTLVYLVLAFGAIAAVSSTYTAWTVYQALSREYESKALAIAQGIAGSSAELFLDGDAGAVQSVIDQFPSIDGVSYVLVTDAAGGVMAHTFVPQVPRAVLDALDQGFGKRTQDHLVLDVTDDDGSFLHVCVPVLHGRAGAVHIGMDMGRVGSVIFKTVVNTQGIALVLFVIFAVAAYVFMNNISQPLVRLTDYARRVARHDFPKSIDIDSNDEVGELARALSITSEELSGLILELEGRVAEATSELRDALASISAIISNVADGLLVIDADGTVVQHNPAFMDMFGMTPRDLVEADVSGLLGLGLEELMDRSGRGVCDLPPDGETEDAACRSQAPATIEIECMRKDGGKFPAEVSISVLAYHGDLNAVLILRDVTEQRQARLELEAARNELELRVAERTVELSRTNENLQAEVNERRAVERALRHAEQKFRGIFENAVEGIFQIAPDGRFMDVNPALARILGFSTGGELMSALQSGEFTLLSEPGGEKALLDEVLSRGEVLGLERRVTSRDERAIWVAVNVRAVLDDDGELQFYEGSVEDATQRKEAETRLKHQAFHDPLTSLPNRTLFLDRLNMAMQRGKRRSGYIYAVLYLDLDRFKVINDSLGHGIGDELLKNVSAKLEYCVRTMDTVARFGGDEFAVLLEDLTAPREAIKIARRILDELSLPTNLKGYEVVTSTSIGIVLNTDGYDSPGLILRDADTAMYRAKEMGKGRFKVFNQKMHDQAVRLLELETDLRKAVERDEFELAFQPIVDMSSTGLEGFEALLRWRHPRLGLVMPGEFICLAEDTGLILPMGHWVMQRVCETVARWSAMPGAQPVNVALNLSAKQFMQPGLVAEVRGILNSTGVDPSRLKFEITESVLMDNADAAVDMLTRLRELGIRVSMDDFGTGYSSLSYLQRFPIDVVKIDRSFISQMDQDEESMAIVRSIVSLARTLGLRTVAEGVDSPRKLFLIREMGCDFVQGYLFSKPVPEAEAEALVMGESRLAAGA